MASLYEFLRHYFLAFFDPLLEELLCYLPTRFRPHIFDYIIYEDSNHESVHSHDSSIFAFYSNDLTYFSWRR